MAVHVKLQNQALAIPGQEFILVSMCKLILRLYLRSASAEDVKGNMDNLLRLAAFATATVHR
ncbi:hypothetical protein WN944_013766 [Citrus x changshan-huyou]|uniref:Uncharacterized protein n=1 Tax=Citrus x changshan-huyou TaxID=2935761 RepID=A0AAP0M9C8_9ROSI